MIRQPEGPILSLPPLPDSLGAPVGKAAQPRLALGTVASAPTREQIEQAVAQANRQMSAIAPSLQFEIDPETHTVVIRLVDREDQRVLRQVPSVEMLAIARALQRMQALLVRTRA